MGKQTDDWGDELPSRPHPLEYGTPRRPTKATGSFVVQAAAGFFCWFAVDWIAVGMMMSSRGTISGSVLIGSVATVLVLLLALGAYLRVQEGNRGFIPGLLLGVGLTCLLPMAALWMICGAPGQRLL